MAAAMVAVPVGLVMAVLVVLVWMGVQAAMVVRGGCCSVMVAMEVPAPKVVRVWMGCPQRWPVLPAPTEAMVLAVLAVVLAAPAAGSLDWPDRVAPAELVAMAALEAQELQALMAPLPERLVRTAAMAVMVVMVVPADKAEPGAVLRCCSTANWAVVVAPVTAAQVVMLALRVMVEMVRLVMR